MINRFSTQCLTCGHRNTLRITLGYDIRQEHTFACAECGEPNKVALSIDFKNRRQILSLPDIPQLTVPTVQFFCLENCKVSKEQGTITNLDATFLVPEHLVHEDRVFPWMEETKNFPRLREFEEFDQKHIDIGQVLGSQRNLRELLGTFCKAVNLDCRQKSLLAQQQLEALQALLGTSHVPSIAQASVLVAIGFLGQGRRDDVPSLVDEARACKRSNANEYQRFRNEFLRVGHADALSRYVGLIDEYLRAYEQFIQLWIYAVRDVGVPEASISSSRDLQKVKMFYGNAFEALSVGLVLPACLNNIKDGRAYDVFAAMDLRKYLTINKANRTGPFKENAVFSLLYDEFDSTIRNSSHHGAMRIAQNSVHHVDYRSGDTGSWKRMSYATYLLKCNRIMLCTMRLLALETLVVVDAV